MKISWFIASIILCLASVSSLAQELPDDAVTASMTQYLHALNGGEVSEEKLSKQLAFMQKVRNLWVKERFQELRHKPLKDIIEQNIGHDLFISAVAFSEKNVEEALEHIDQFKILENKKDQVLKLLNRAAQFRNELRRWGSPMFEPLNEFQAYRHVSIIQDNISTAFSPDARSLAILYKQKVVVWNTNFPYNFYNINFSKDLEIGGPYLNVYFSKDGKSIMTHHYSHQVSEGLRWGYYLMWSDIGRASAETYSRYLSTDWFPDSTDGMIVHPETERIAYSKERDGIIRIDKFGSFGHGSILMDERRKVTRTQFRPLVFSSDGSTLAAAVYGNDGSVPVGDIDIWDVAHNRFVKTLKSVANPGLYDQIVSLAFSPDGNFLISVSAIRGTVEFWDVKAGLLIKSLPRRSGENDAEKAIFSTDGKYFLVGYRSGEIKGYDTILFNEFSVGHHHPSGEKGWHHRIDSLTMSTDSKLLASADRSGLVVLWRVDRNGSNNPPDLGLIYMADPDSDGDKK